MKKYLAVIAAWLVAYLLILALPIDIPAATGIAFLLFLPLGLTLVLIFLVALIRKRKRLEPALAILLVVFICIIGFNHGTNWGARIHLFTNKARYEAVLEKVSSTQNPEEREEICGDTCRILSNEPLRVGFHYAHWFLNWKHVVHDPTGLVKGDDFSALRRLDAYLFGGEHRLETGILHILVTKWTELFPRKRAR